MVDYVLHEHEPFTGISEGTVLSRTKQSQWPRLASPSSERALLARALRA